MIQDSEYLPELTNRVMHSVLPDSDRAFAWLERRIEEEDAWYRHCNEKANLRFRELGFDDELTYDRAMEYCRTTGNEQCFDLDIGLWQNHNWRV